LYRERIDLKEVKELLIQQTTHLKKLKERMDQVEKKIEELITYS